MTDQGRPTSQAEIKIVDRLAEVIGSLMVTRHGPREIAREVMDWVGYTLLAWAEEADADRDVPFEGRGLRWASEEFARDNATAPSDQEPR